MTTHRISPALAALALLALGFAAYLGVLAWQSPSRSAVAPIGVLFVGNFFQALVAFVIEEVAVRP